MSPESVDLERVDHIVEKYKNRRRHLIAILQEVQKEQNYLPREALFHLSKRLKVPLNEVYHVATFYKSFSLVPRGEHLIQVCMGTACHVRGAPRILERIERSLGVESGRTTTDYKFTLETVNCLGACALGPLMVIDGKYFGKMTASKVDEVLQGYQE